MRYGRYRYGRYRSGLGMADIGQVKCGRFIKFKAEIVAKFTFIPSLTQQEYLLSPNLGKPVSSTDTLDYIAYS